MDWKRDGENVVPLGDLKPGQVEAVHLHGHGERAGAPITRRLMAFKARDVKESGPVVVNEKGEESTKDVTRRVLSGNASFSKDGSSIVFPAAEGPWPAEDWTSLSVVIVAGSESVKLDAVPVV